MCPVRVDVITPLPEGWGLCVTCEAFMDQAGLGQVPYKRSLESFPPDWQEEFIRLSDFVQKVSQEYGDQILIRLYDPRSMPGLVKAIRNGVHTYPTFLVECGSEIGTTPGPSQKQGGELKIIKNKIKAKITGLQPERIVEAIRTAQRQADIQHGND